MPPIFKFIIKKYLNYITKFIMKSFPVLIIAIVFFFGCNPKEQKTTSDLGPSEKEKSLLSYSIANQFPHDTMSFTEGFLFHEGQLFESTGSPDNVPYARSVFGPLDLNTGKINVKAELDRKVYFGEGILFINNQIFQLTYKNQICFVYDAKTYKKIKQYSFANTEGWGMTTDGKEIIMSDGTNMLTFLNPDNFTPTRSLQITDNGFAVDYLNELEFIKGYIYANIWGTNTIVKINPVDGNVVGKLDLTAVAEDARSKHPRLFEMNGIAYDASADKIYVTGKMWSQIYQIDFAH